MKQDELVALFQKCIGDQTPYIRTEGGSGLYDLMVYIGDDNGILLKDTKIKEKTKVHKCVYRKREEFKGTYICRKKKEKLNLVWRDYVHLHNKEEITSSEYYVKENEFFDSLSEDIRKSNKKSKQLKNLLKDAGYISAYDTWLNTKTMEFLSYKEGLVKILCTGVNCGMFATYYDIRRSREKTDFHLEKGLHLFEFKSNHDNVYRFFEQIPQYLMALPDFVWLIIGDRVKVPSYLPSWIGLFKHRGKGFVLKRRAKDIYWRMPNYNLYGLNAEELGPTNSSYRKYRTNAFMIYQFLRSWFLRSQYGWTIGFPTKIDNFDELFEVKGKKKKDPNILFKKSSEQSSLEATA